MLPAGVVGASEVAALADDDNEDTDEVVKEGANADSGEDFNDDNDDALKADERRDARPGARLSRHRAFR